MDKVEVGVQRVQRWIVARLGGRHFFSLAELNATTRELLEAFNGKLTRHLGASHRQLFETLDRPALTPLPAMPYEYANGHPEKSHTISGIGCRPPV
ncbi:MAG: hypothetical protein AAF371_16690 [Pseudomonadota bacterium]